MSKALTASHFFLIISFDFGMEKYLFLWYPFHFGTVSKPNSHAYFHDEVCIVTENIWVHGILTVELMSWEYVNIWSICCKTKFVWTQYTQRNTKTKTTTIRTQNNARAVSAFNSLSHYMHRNKPPFFFLVDVWSFQTQQIQKSLGWRWWCWLTPIIPGLRMHLSSAWLYIKSHGETTQQSSLLAVQ